MLTVFSEADATERIAYEAGRDLPEEIVGDEPAMGLKDTLDGRVPLNPCRG